MSKTYQLLNCNPLFKYFDDVPWQMENKLALDFFNEVRTVRVAVPKKMYIEEPYDETDINSYPIKVKRVSNNE